MSLFRFGLLIVEIKERNMTELKEAQDKFLTRLSPPEYTRAINLGSSGC